MYLFTNEVQFHFTKLLHSSFYTDHVRFYTVRSVIADHFRSTILLLVCAWSMALMPFELLLLLLLLVCVCVCATDMW